MLFKISQISQANTCIWSLFLIKLEICEIFKNTYSEEHLERLLLRVFQRTSLLGFKSPERLITMFVFYILNIKSVQTNTRYFLLLVNNLELIMSIWFRSSRLKVFCKKGVLRNFTKFTGKHLCQSIFFNKNYGSRHWGNLEKSLLLLLYCTI